MSTKYFLFLYRFSSNEMKLTSKIRDYVLLQRYNIGFIDGDLQSVMEGNAIRVNWVKHNYKGRGFADPFILDVTENEILVLVEEWYDPIQRGRISKLTVDKKTYELRDIKVLLESETHLSFPMIARKDNGIYVYPENSATGKWIEYRYNPETEELIAHRTMASLPLTDSVVCDYFEEPLMFSTCLPDANGKELGIYSWDDTRQEYAVKEYFHFTENLSRMAGDFFKYQDKIYRPAQVCIQSYGDAVSIQEVTYENGKWIFREIKRIYSPHPDYDLGFHTFNMFKDVIVVDALGFRKPKLCHFLRKLWHVV